MFVLAHRPTTALAMCWDGSEAAIEEMAAAGVTLVRSWCCGECFAGKHHGVLKVRTGEGSERRVEIGEWVVVDAGWTSVRSEEEVWSCYEGGTGEGNGR